MNHSQKVDMLFIYSECQKNERRAAQTYDQCYPDREHPAHSFIYNLKRNLKTYGSLSKSVKNQQRKRGDVLDKKVEEQLLAYVRSNSRVSGYGTLVESLEYLIPQFLITGLDKNPLILNSILWTDESKFTNNGVINKQNNRYWDDQNPHWTFETI
ncbi:Protein of unknown function DUF4817 [Cinara cedri]|uniref:DUF4817 domain-containing protein n=1 Tax=Cinara cedri TaxID=506608 RepID=A0A5E4MJI4_9HEMI|nr:Protein of unknown function DUF4817 [Cinara cedri]